MDLHRLSPAGLSRRTAAQWLAYALPYGRFAIAGARLGADAVRYSFIVADSHHLLLAGLTGALNSSRLPSRAARASLRAGVARYAFTTLPVSRCTRPRHLANPLGFSLPLPVGRSTPANRTQEKSGPIQGATLIFIAGADLHSAQSRRRRAMAFGG